MNKKKFSDSLIMIFTYTINSARMLDMNHFRQHKNHRITALVDSELKYLFTPYEPLFDDVYYFEIHYKHHCFIESFSKVAKDAIIKELALCERLKLISFFEGDIEATAKLRDQFHLSGLRFSQAQQFRNKLLMKKILTENQMLVPRGRSIDWDLPCRVLFQQCISELGFPFILKPTHLAGSLGVSLVSSYAQFVTIYHKHIDTDYIL